MKNRIFFPLLIIIGLFCAVLLYVFLIVNKLEVDYKSSTSNLNYEGINYSNLNYTTLNISEDEFKNLPEYRQIDWLNGWCYPYDCHSKNPPICTSFYLIQCINPDSKENKYFRDRYLN